MKRLLAISLLIAAIVGHGFAQSRFTTYYNDRFYFSIDYPSDLLKEQPAPENNDGRTFISKDGSVEMRAWGQFNALDRSLKEEYDEAVNNYGSGVSYKRRLASSFIVSGTSEDKIFYQKTMLKKSGNTDVFYTFTIEYPKSMKKKLDAAVTRIAASFKFDRSEKL